MFFSPMENLLMPGQPENMGQGWETRRSRPPGEDWIIVQLGEPGRLSRVEVHTTHFKGNYPEACALDGLYWPGAPPWSLVTAGRWTELRGWSPLRAHAAHELELERPGPWTHVRLRIRPDGGVARLRVHGTPTDERPGDSDPLVSGLNALDADAAAAALGRCCGARRWVAAMVAARPFSSRTELLGVAETAWWRLGEVDWLEAFEHHPRIGADVEALREKFAATAGWSEGEQSGVEGADEATLQALADCNRRYEAAHGFIFIVCASGKSAEEMLAIVQQRLPSERHMELNVAAGEQAKITALRLEKLELP